LRNRIEDGRRYLQDADTQYDLIFGDVYYSYFSVPPHFTTQEFFALARSKLRPEGVFIANIIGDLSRREPSLIMAEIKTFQTVFPNSYFFAVESVARTDQVQNITLVGYNSSRRVDVAAPPVTTDPNPIVRFLRFRVLDVDRRFELSPYAVLTDDFSPVEYLTARVLRRAFDEPAEVDGDEMRAVAHQLLRYGAAGPGAPGRAQVRDFLRAELAVLTEDVTVEDTRITASLFASETRRAVLAARTDDAVAVAVLVELARSLVFSPMPPPVGVDIVFFEPPAAPPAAATVLQDVCEEGDRATVCGADRLSSAALRLLERLRSGQA
jgi:hypothetical protein